MGKTWRLFERGDSNAPAHDPCPLYLNARHRSSLAGAGKAGNADGTDAAAEFNGPRGIAYCANDKSLYVADRDNEEIRKVTLDGVVSTLAGAPEAGFADGTGTAARLDHPQGIACDPAGNIYVSGTSARFANPTDLWFEQSDASLYVIDEGSNNIRKVTTVAGS
jgi:DNA-binding beta-propeller fold protein YncE